jgi:hypothetical protein
LPPWKKNGEVNEDFSPLGLFSDEEKLYKHLHRELPELLNHKLIAEPPNISEKMM